MKKLIYLLFLLPILCFGQADVIRTKPVAASGSSFNQQAVSDANLKLAFNLRIPRVTQFGYAGLNGARDTAGYIAFNTTIGKMGVYLGGGNWDTLKTAPPESLQGGIITTLPLIGDNPGTGITPVEFITKEFYGTQLPTATLTGGQTYELSNSPHTHTLNYSYGRQPNTNPILTVVLTPGFVNLYSTQPAQPGIVSGTQSVTTGTNATVTYIITVTTNDGKVNTASTTDSSLPGNYWGRTATLSPSNSVILATVGGLKVLSSTKVNTGFVVTASGSNHVYYTYPSSEGSLSSIKIGGFESIEAFTQSTISLTNASGYTQNYFLYVSNNTFSADTPTIVTQ